MFRVGWSIDQADLGLGEVDNSYGYGGAGKTSSGNKFYSYGEPYGPGDVIGCFLVSTIANTVVYIFLMYFAWKTCVLLPYAYVSSY